MTETFWWEVLAVTTRVPFPSVQTIALLLIGLFAWSVPALASDSAPLRSVPAEISGLIQVYGCPVDPAFFRISVTPVGAVMPNDKVRYSDPHVNDVVADISETGDPHFLRFVAGGLARGSLYQLGVSAYQGLSDLPDDHPLAHCQKIFWRGPERGLVVAGDRPVLLEGFVARAELEVRSADPDSGLTWLGKDQLQFDDPEQSARVLRWRSWLPGTIGVELQVSTEPFPTAGDFSNCDEPERGIVARIWQDQRGDPAEFQETPPIDFGAILRPGRTGAPADAPADTAAPTAADLAMLDLGAPVYVRAVPQTADGGPACDTAEQGVAGWVVMAKVPADFDVPPPPVVPPAFEAWDENRYEPPYIGQPAIGHPAYGELAYKVIKPHQLPTAEEMKAAKKGDFWVSINDPLGYLLVSTGLSKPGDVLATGTWFYYRPVKTASGGGLVSDFTSALGGLGSALGGLVTASAGLAGSFIDYMHYLTEQIKASVAKAVVDVAGVLPGVEAFCDAVASNTSTSCEELVEQGMNYGLTSMGVPPSIPSWTELKEDGASYLAAQVSSAIGDPTGVTQQLTEDELLAMVDYTTSQQTAARGGDDPRYDWVVPYLGFEPAVLTLSLKKNVEGDLPKNLVIRVKPTPLFAGLNVAVPYRFPGDSTLLRVPVVLPPNMSGFPPPRCTIDPLWHTTCNPDPTLAEPLCIGQYVDTNGLHSMSLPCGAVNHPGIYYREAWVQYRLLQTDCAPLSAVGWYDIGGLYLAMTPPYVELATVPPLLHATWDGSPYYLCN